MVDSKVYFALKYPSQPNGWVATLGAGAEQNFDPQTGKEDFSEQRRVGAYLESWRPGQEWKPQPICLHFEARGRQLIKTDRIFHNAVGPIFSENAVTSMRSFLEENGHVLPLKVANAEKDFFLWWLPYIENSIDWNKSEKFPNGLTIKRYTLNDSVVAGVSAFRLHYTGMHNPSAQGQVLVDEEFKKSWLKAGLTGIEFVPA